MNASASMAGLGRVYITIAGACAAYAIWGSLFPFDVRWVPLADAAAQFWTAWRTSPSIWSLSDIGSNVLLFVPIGLFGAAALEARWPDRSSAPAVGAGAGLLSAAVELAQAFVRLRTPSIVDVVAETAGAGLGFLVWRLARTQIARAARLITGQWDRAGWPERVLWVYCALFAGAWLFPFDVTLRPNEIAHKYEHQRLLLPFTPSPDAATPMHLGLVCAATVPLGCAGMRCARGEAGRSAGRAVVLVALALIALETLQVTVFSRTTDATLLVVALPAAALGASVTTILQRLRV